MKYLWFWSQKKKNELNLKIVQISFDQKKRIEAEEAAMLTSEEFKQDACNRLTDRVRDEI